jgi:polar amino acid transport system substrate-binding protein
MRVGVVESPPWVVRTAGQPGGVEPGLVRQFAASIRATPEWFRGGEQQHMEALERFELDLVIGGLDARTPWKKRIAFTSPYFEEQIAVGVPKATQEPAGLNGLKVKVLEGDVTAAYLLKQHGIALRVPTLSNPTMPVAAPVWRLQQMGLIPTHLRLFEKEHVIAVPPGENGWLKALGDFLQSHRSAVQSLLATSEAQP